MHGSAALGTALLRLVCTLWLRAELGPWQKVRDPGERVLRVGGCRAEAMGKAERLKPENKTAAWVLLALHLALGSDQCVSVST